MVDTHDPTHREPAVFVEAVVDALPLFVAYADRAGLCRYQNKACHDWFQSLSGGETIGRTLEEILGASRYATLRPHVAAVLSGQTIGFELTVDLGARSLRLFQATLIPDLEPEGGVRGFFVMAHDVTDERRLVTAAAESEARFRAMADHSPVLLWMSGADGLCTFFNQHWLDFTGRSMAQERGVGWAEGVHPEDFQNCMHVFLSSFVERKPFRMEYRLRRKDGQYRWVLDTGIPRPAPGGEFAGYVGSCIDVTDRRRAEEETEALLREMRRARDEAERANRVKDEFLATLSHELRTPLNAILGWASMLRDGLLNESEAEKAVASIVRNAHAQTRLVSDILDVSRITSGQMRLNMLPGRVSHAIRAALEAVKPAALAKEVTIETRIEEPPYLLALDAARIQQVVWNLLANAMKFVPHHGHIQIEVGEANGEMTIRVDDDGPGIPEAFLPYLFHRFRQADAGSTRRFGGLGLGLAIARHIVELHGGSISAGNRPEGGARFSFSLPARRAEDRRAGRSLADPPAEAVPTADVVSLQGIEVLVVDDDADSREVAAAVLVGFGALARIAGSAAEALAEIERKAPDVLIADIGMPGEDGHTLLMRLRRMPREKGGATPAVALSAYATLHDRTRALESGFQAHVPKPAPPLELARIVARLAFRPNGPPERRSRDGA